MSIADEHYNREAALRAINRKRDIVQHEEHELLVLIALQRVQSGNVGRFEFRGKWYFAKEVNEHRAHNRLVIFYYRDGNRYYETLMPIAEDLQQKYAEGCWK